MQTASANNYVAFGMAANGETSYFAMTSIGGTVRISASSDGVIRFVRPDAGGRIKVKGVLRRLLTCIRGIGYNIRREEEM